MLFTSNIMEQFSTTYASQIMSTDDIKVEEKNIKGNKLKSVP